MMRRSRSTANLLVSVDDYRSAVRTWFEMPPITHLRAKCGPKFATDARAVSPAMAIQVMPLLLDLAKAGCANAVVQTSKMEIALRHELSKDCIVAGADSDLDSLAHQVTQHIQSVCSTLRSFMLEEATHGGSHRRYPRSGGFRKKCPLPTTLRWRLCPRCFESRSLWSV